MGLRITSLLPAGNCDFDVRHNLSTAFSYDLPNVGHGGFVNAVSPLGARRPLYRANGFSGDSQWELDLSTRTGQLFMEGLNLVPGQPVYIYGANCASVSSTLDDLATGLDVRAVARSTPMPSRVLLLATVDAPRNFARGFGAWQMDLAVRRDFPIYERLKLQFRAEAFNIFNHPNFGAINSNLGQNTLVKQRVRSRVRWAS